MSDTAIDTAAVPGTAASEPTPFLLRLLRKPLALAAFAWLAVVAVCALFAAKIAPYDPLDSA